MWNDLRYAVRMLRLSPGFSALVILTFGLAIGLNTALFSVVDALLLRSLPGFETDRIVTLWEKHGANELDALTGPTIRTWRAQAKSFESIEAGTFDPLNLTDVDPAEVVKSARVTAGYFHLCRVQALVGRTFLADEDKPGRNLVAVLDYAFWQRKFGGDPKLVGRTLRLDRKNYLVVGLLPREFHPLGPDVGLYVPLAMEDLPAWSFWTAARLRPGVRLEMAQAEMADISRALESADPKKKGVQVRVVPLHQIAQQGIRTGLLTLFAAVALVLLIACANIANLFLARTSSRARELGLRLALGAKPIRLVRQVVTEGLLLSMLGGVCGVLLAVWALAMLIQSGAGLDRLEEVRVDWAVIAFALALTVLTGLLATAGPALGIIRRDLTYRPQSGSREANSSMGQNRSRRLLVITEIAVTFLLVAASALALQSFQRLAQVDPGYDPHHLLTLALSSPTAEHSNGDAVLATYRRIGSRLTALPGVRSVTMATRLPIGGIGFAFPIRVQGRPSSGHETPDAQTSVVIPGYFRTMGIRLLRGREFTAQDRRGSTLKAIINDAVARGFFGREDPIGKTLLIETFDPNVTTLGTPVPHEIVGIAADVRQDDLREKSPYQLYLSLDQNPVSFISVAIRTAGDPAALAPTVQRDIAREDRDLPATDVKPMDQKVQDALASFRQAATLISGFAGLAVLLAFVGVYGVVSYSVSKRTHEIGIRMALGSSGGGIAGLILRETARIAFWGIAIGFIGILAGQRLIDSQLYDVRATDPLSLVAVSIGLMTIALAAASIPARLASQVDPMESLRVE